MAVSSADIQNWFAANPNATPDQIASAAAAAGVTAAQIDQALGSGTVAQDYVAQNLPAMASTYGTNFGVDTITPAQLQALQHQSTAMNDPWAYTGPRLVSGLVGDGSSGGSLTQYQGGYVAVPGDVPRSAYEMYFSPIGGGSEGDYVASQGWQYRPVFAGDTSAVTGYEAIDSQGNPTGYTFSDPYAERQVTGYNVGRTGYENDWYSDVAKQRQDQAISNAIGLGIPLSIIGYGLANGGWTGADALNAQNSFDTGAMMDAINGGATSGGFDTSLFSGLGDTMADTWAQSMIDVGMPTNDAIALATEMANAGMTDSAFQQVLSGVAQSGSPYWANSTLPTLGNNVMLGGSSLGGGTAGGSTTGATAGGIGGGAATGAGAVGSGVLGGGSGGGTTGGTINIPGLGNIPTSALSTLLGGAAGLLGATSAPSKITTTTEPWAGQQPYLLDLFSKAQQAANSASTPNALQTKASDFGLAALNSPLNNQAQTAVSGLLTSDPSQMYGIGAQNAYMGQTNPYLQKSIDDASSDLIRNYRLGTQSQTDKMFANSNAFGGSAYNETVANNERNLASQLGTLANNQRYAAYQQDAGLYENMLNRNNNQYNMAYAAKNNAAFNTPNLIGQTVNTASNAYGLGTNQQLQPFQSLNAYGNLVTGNYGQSTTQPNYTNPLASALGGALGGYQLGKLF